MIEAIIWDYDGTLVDTRQKNLNVTRRIVFEVLNRSFEEFPVLLNVENYQQANTRSVNWRDLYATAFGMNEEQTDYAGSLWTKHQLLDDTEAQFYQGLYETINEFGTRYPQAIVSLNSYENIRKSLVQNGLADFFKQVMGYEEVGYSQQKPAPEALLKCIEGLGLHETTGIIIYIGDHETDAHCVFNANTVMGRKKVVSIGAMYEKDQLTEGWKYKPDFIATKTNELATIVQTFYYMQFKI